MYIRITVLYASKHSIYLWLSSQSCRCHKSTRVWLLRLVNSLFDMTSVSKLTQTAIWAQKSFIYYWALKNCFVAAVICFSTKNSSRFQNCLIRSVTRSACWDKWRIPVKIHATILFLKYFMSWAISPLRSSSFLTISSVDAVTFGS